MNLSDITAITDMRSGTAVNITAVKLSNGVQIWPATATFYLSNIRPVYASGSQVAASGGFVYCIADVWMRYLGQDTRLIVDATCDITALTDGGAFIREQRTVGGQPHYVASAPSRGTVVGSVIIGAINEISVTATIEGTPRQLVWSGEIRVYQEANAVTSRSTSTRTFDEFEIVASGYSESNPCPAFGSEEGTCHLSLNGRRVLRVTTDYTYTSGQHSYSYDDTPSTIPESDIRWEAVSGMGDDYGSLDTDVETGETIWLFNSEGTDLWPQGRRSQISATTSYLAKTINLYQAANRVEREYVENENNYVGTVDFGADEDYPSDGIQNHVAMNYKRITSSYAISMYSSGVSTRIYAGQTTSWLVWDGRSVRFTALYDWITFTEDPDEGGALINVAANLTGERRLNFIYLYDGSELVDVWVQWQSNESCDCDCDDECCDCDCDDCDCNCNCDDCECDCDEECEDCDCDEECCDEECEECEECEEECEDCDCDCDDECCDCDCDDCDCNCNCDDCECDCDEECEECEECECYEECEECGEE